MKHSTTPLFALPVTEVSLDCADVPAFFDAYIKPNTGRPNGDGTTAYQTPLIHYHNDENIFEIYPELRDLGEQILAAGNFVYRDVMNHDTSLRITNAWINECHVGGRQFMHNHCNSVISGTLYLRTDANTCIQFQSPYGLNDFGNLLLDEPNVQRPNRFGYQHHFRLATYRVQNGTCLFWPSHLRHGYSENLTPGRLSLSFNLLPEQFNCVYQS